MRVYREGFLDGGLQHVVEGAEVFFRQVFGEGRGDNLKVCETDL